MSYQVRLGFRLILLLGGLGLLLQPLRARQDEESVKIDYEVFFSTTKEKVTAEYLKELPSDLAVRPNTELPYSLFVMNNGDQGPVDLKVYITESKFQITKKDAKSLERLKREAIFVGEARGVTKKGTKDAIRLVPLQATKKAATAAPVASDPKAEPVKPLCSHRATQRCGPRRDYR
jgi:hypothetical protein